MMSSASFCSSTSVLVGATGTGRTSFRGLRARITRRAALIVAPVAMPSSITIAIWPAHARGTQISLPPPFDLRKFSVTDRVECSFVDFYSLDHILIPHDDGCRPVD